ncbi:MAG: CBS domain-containing protein [Bdellovibrionales bacterium]|nr:CBS domain-containing protein [Bdellovibrionales bacterium]
MNPASRDVAPLDITIREVMTPFPHSIGLDQSLSLAKERMREFNIRHLPVQDGGKLVGIVTDRDMSFALGLEKKSDDEMSVEEVYTAEPYTVSAGTRLGRVLEHMAKDHIGCALVLEHDKLVGIYTTVDACRDLSLLLEQGPDALGRTSSFRTTPAAAQRGSA